MDLEPVEVVLSIYFAVLLNHFSNWNLREGMRIRSDKAMRNLLTLYTRKPV